MTLREIILDEIRSRGPISFAHYMEMCLYHPELGYYSRAREQFGKTGDFFTSSDVHAVFGRLLARQFDEMWRTLEAPASLQIMELGPGRGLFAHDVLDWSAKKFSDFFRAVGYVLIESSPALRARLEERFAERIAQGKVSVHATIDEAPHAENAIIFANEFFDALPVEVISEKGELRISENNGRFVEQFVPPTPLELEYLDQYGVHPDRGERVETPLASQEHMTRMAEAVPRGFVVVVDYGYTRAEQLTGRHRDTVMTYRQHTASGNPYEAPGEQDITAHVNFSALAAAGATAGLEQLALLTQAQFLMGIAEPNQFADAFEDCVLPQERAKVALQLKHLVTPAGMGETFHVLLMARGVDKRKAMALTGLSFAH